MLALRFSQRVRILTVALFAAVAVFAFALPVRAEDNRAAQAKRTTTSLANPQQAPVGATAPGRPGLSTAFLYFPGAQPGMNIGGRLNVGKSHVYVPYYGNVSNDPTHPGVQGTAGIAYGFRTWDISVLNGGFGTAQPEVPGVTAPKVNPALTFSIRF
jgi:hypothetical protein